MLQVDQPAPPFRGRTTDGKEVALEDFRGRYLVLYFFPKAFTPGCTIQAKRFRDNYPELKALGAEVVGVSVDDHETQCRFSAAHELSFPILSDQQKQVSKAFATERTLLPFNKRVTYIIDPEGKVVARFHHEFQIHKHLDDVVSFLKKQVGSERSTA